MNSKRAIVALVLLCLLGLVMKRYVGRQEWANVPQDPNPEEPSREVSRRAPVTVQSMPARPEQVENPPVVLDPRADPRFRNAVATFDSFELEKARFPTNRNGWGRLGDMQRKLFLDDCAILASNGVIGCDQREEVFQRVKASWSGVAQGEHSSTAEVHPSQGSSILQDRYTLLKSSGNEGMLNVAAALETRVDLDPFGTQLYLDASIYVASQTYLRGLIQEEIRHGEGTKQRLAKLLEGENSSQIAEFSKTVESEVEDLRSVARSYRTVFQKRFEREYGGEWDELMNRLDGIDLVGEGPELSVPCP